MPDTTIIANDLPTGWTIYAQIRDADDLIWDGSAFVAYNVANWTSYDVAATETPASSGTYVVPFPPTIPAGAYTWTLFKQAAGTPASTDGEVSEPSPLTYWDGTEFGGASDADGQAIAAINEILTQAIGTDKAYNLTLRDSNGDVITTYTGAETLSCRIWSGHDQATLASPTATWIVAAEGTIQIVVSDVDIAGLVPGLYRMALTITSGTTVTLVFDGSINLTSLPGVAAAPLTYCSFEDMRLYAPQVQNLQDTRTDLAGFLGNRARARTWTNERCLDGYRPNYGRARRYVSADGSAAGPHLRWVTSGPNGEATPTIDELRTAIDAGGLRVTDLVREANAHMAAAIVYLNQPGNNNPYHQSGAYHASKAASLLRDSVIEIDLDDDDTYDVRIGQDVTWLQ